jgi:hypothetical protein
VLGLLDFGIHVLGMCIDNVAAGRLLFCDGGGGPAHGAGLVCCSSENVWFSIRSKRGDWRKFIRPVRYHVSSSSSSCHRWVRRMSASPRQF